MSCLCESPLIRCDHRGCRCTLCGELERVRISPRLQAVIDETRRKIAEAAKPSFRVRVRIKEPHP